MTALREAQNITYAGVRGAGALGEAEGRGDWYTEAYGHMSEWRDRAGTRRLRAGNRWARAMEAPGRAATCRVWVAPRTESTKPPARRAPTASEAWKGSTPRAAKAGRSARPARSAATRAARATGVR
jgi:hypothetical protein